MLNQSKDDPDVVFSTYIRAKMNHSRNRAHGSKVWAAKVMQRTPILKERLRDNLYEWAKLKESKIREGAGLAPALCLLRYFRQARR